MDLELLDFTFYASPVFDLYKNSFQISRKAEPITALQRNMEIIEVLNIQPSKKPLFFIVICRKICSIRPLHHNHFL